MAQETNDVQFISELIDFLVMHFNADPNRVYVTGFSNGAFMTYRLMCELSEKVAAAAPVGGAMPRAQQTQCSMSHNVPLMHFHGTADSAAPFTGSGFFLSVEDTTAFFAFRYMCDMPPATVSLADLDPTDGTSVDKTVYQNCFDGGEVEYFTIFGGEHNWPGGPDTSSGLPTPQSQDINASQEMWDFFTRFTLP